MSYMAEKTENSPAAMQAGPEDPKASPKTSEFTYDDVSTTFEALSNC